MKALAEHYRERAKSLRALAESMTSPVARNTLLSVAKEYDAWAERFDPSVPPEAKKTDHPSRKVP